MGKKVIQTKPTKKPKKHSICRKTIQKERISAKDGSDQPKPVTSSGSKKQHEQTVCELQNQISNLADGFLQLKKTMDTLTEIVKFFSSELKKTGTDIEKHQKLLEDYTLRLNLVWSTDTRKKRSQNQAFVVRRFAE